MSTKLQLGDLVEFITSDHEYGISTLKIKEGDNINIYKTGHTKMNAPVMVVIEVLFLDNTSLYDENTGKKIKDDRSINCQWFSHHTNSFKTRWFNSGVLTKIESEHKVHEEFNLNEIVILKTASFKNINYENILKQKLQKESGTINYELSQVYDSSFFLPPKMVVVSTEVKENKTPKFNSKTGKVKRLLSSLHVKCMWFDYKTGKFSESFFTREALIGISDLSKELLISQFNRFDSESE